jgi:hypothetical protein
VYGTSVSGVGVDGYSSTGTGVSAFGGTGVQAAGKNFGLYASGPTAVSGISGSTASYATAIYGEISSTSPGSWSAGLRAINSSTDANGIGVWGSQNGAGWGVLGYTPTGTGVYGYTPSGVGVNGTSKSYIGVVGQGATGVQAYGSNVGLAASGSIGVSASGSGPMGIAVSATASSSLPALAASNGGSGPAVRASNPSGVALQVNGITQFSRSGLATIGAGRKQVVVTLANVSPSSIVLATLQNVVPNVLVAGVVVGSGKFTIVLSRATPSPAKVGWFVIG